MWVDIVKKGQLHEYYETHHPADYERMMDDMDPMQAHAAWEAGEEAEEKVRQCLVRWKHFERDLPAGSKCDERVAHEKDEAAKKQQAEAAQVIAAQKKEQRRKEFYAKREAKKRQDELRLLAEKWFLLMDKDGNGSIDKTEFYDFCDR